MTVEATFTQIYTKRLWGHGSGPGSSPANTVAYVDWIQDLVLKKPGLRILDVGCGDWQFSRLIDWTGVDYTGVDPVRSVIENNRVYESPSVRFVHGDVLDMDLTGFDVAIVKDVLQHLSFADITLVLNALAPVPRKLITNGFPHDGINRDCVTGRYRPLHMYAPPFSLRGSVLLRFGAVTTSENGKELFDASPI